MWQISLGLGEGETIHQIRSHHQTASDIEHEQYLPTSFVGDNIIYKYLDSNLFAVSTVDHLGRNSLSTSSTASVERSSTSSTSPLW